MTTESRTQLPVWRSRNEMNSQAVRQKRLSSKAFSMAKSKPRLKPKEIVTEDDIWVREALYHRLPTY